MALATRRSLPSAANTRADTNAGVGPHFAEVALVANLGTLGVVGAPSRMSTSSELRFVMKSGATLSNEIRGEDGACRSRDFCQPAGATLLPLS